MSLQSGLISLHLLGRDQNARWTDYLAFDCFATVFFAHRFGVGRILGNYRCGEEASGVVGRMVDYRHGEVHAYRVVVPF